MAGTDSTRAPVSFEAAPVFILVRPQLDENMGTSVRAMLNCGLTRLRLVSPRDDHLSDKAIAAASGAGDVLREAEVFSSLDEAIADLRHVYATSARRREMAKPVMTPRHALADIRTALSHGEPCGLLFGPERTGLTNDEMAQADTVVEVPLNPAFASLNLAQAVLIMGYEWYQGGADAPPVELPLNGGRPATRAELLNLFLHLERELDDCGFLRVRDKRPSMVRNLRNMFGRAGLTEQEVRTLHGIITELRQGRRAPG
ncbi:MAG: RNA methyltransferase [Alphaproteobacteria bacterium]|nr:RNA methyltransferase [Alphaproteobacteria bacterium]MBF0128741.1 RNA methyltransferase [Alphaproteobacteria bacterium]